MKPHVRVTSGTKRTSGRKSLDMSRGYPVSKGKPIFQPTSVRFGTGKRGAPTVRIKAIPSNYELKVGFQKRLQENDPKAWTELNRLRSEYEKIVKSGRGTLVIPKETPMTLGQATWLTIGGKYVVFALRSSAVRAYPGFYSMVGGVPFYPKPRRASNKLLRQNAQEEITDELGVRRQKISIGKPMGVQLTLEKDGFGLSVVHSARIAGNVSTFIRDHFRPVDTRDHTKGYTLKQPAKEGWEASHFVLVPNTPDEINAFFQKNKGKMTPLLAHTIQQVLRETK